MGIKHVWSILNPFCERKPLYELEGKTVAIDLSCWICEAQNVAEHSRMYLRNLYFRTCYLLLMEVNPVFVLEGTAPELKYKTIAARNALQFKGAKPKSDAVKTEQNRSRFNHVLKRCEEMLGYMGLSCIKGAGEAESLCAHLNEEGLVDGCISQDSDCFAYGAKVVYRNFSIASQGASSGYVDIYNITKANEHLNFGQNKMIAMALLCGCDYSDGVKGIGQESVLKFFENLQDYEILNVLRSWRMNTEKYSEFEKLLNDKNICTSCGHYGKMQIHKKNGCSSCKMAIGCNSEKFKEERIKIKNELSMRSKALLDPNFPNENLIQEFLIKKDKLFELDLKWRQPDVVKFVQFATKFLHWTELYAFEKILPILTRWQCLNSDSVETCFVKPSHIKKKRNPKGVNSYEIIWTDSENYFKDLIPKEQMEQSDVILEKLWSTIEPQNLVNAAYPNLVKEYEQSKIKPKKATGRRKKELNMDVIGDMLKNTSISEPKPKKTRISKKKTNNLLQQEGSQKLKQKKTKIMDNFLKEALLKTKNVKHTFEISESNGIKDLTDNFLTSTPSKSSPNSMDMSCFGDEDNDDDLSLIVQNIVSRKPFNLEENLKNANIQNILKGFQEDKQNELENIDENLSQRNSFFITCPVENDLFEKTLNDIRHSDTDDYNDTVEYNYDEIEFVDNCKFKNNE